MKFKYNNPIIGNGTPDNIRDPFIIKDSGKYYMTGSLPPFWSNGAPGVCLWSSDNLTEWKIEGFLIERKEIPEDAWYRERMWAPEICRFEGKYYLTVSCQNMDYGHKHSVLVAMADRITGPYKILTKNKPLIKQEDLKDSIGDSYCIANDASMAIVGGKSYLLFCNPRGIYGVELQLPDCTCIGEIFPVVKPGMGTWDTKIEGPFIIQVNKKLICFYSSFTNSYEVGYAVAEDIHGPWIKAAHNPIMTPHGKVMACGHNSVFEGMDGRLWLAYHMQLQDDPVEHLAIDPLDISEDGSIGTIAPTVGQRNCD